MGAVEGKAVRHSTLDRKSRYGLAVVVSIAFLAIRYAFTPLIGINMPLQMLSLATVIAAAAGGFGPGLIATLLCAALGHYLFSAAERTMHLASDLDGLRLITFVLNGTGVSLVAEAMHRALRRARSQSAALASAEETTRRQLAEIEATYRYAPVGMCVFDTDLRWIRINEKLAAINGFPPEAHLGKTIHELLPSIAETVAPTLRQVLQTGEPVLDRVVKGETPAQPGVERTWVQNWVPLKDDAGRVVSINVVALEVTDRIQAEATLRASEERFRTLVQASSNVVWTLGPGGRDPAMQKWWTEFTGVEPPVEDGVASLAWLDAIHPDDRSTVGAIWKAAAAHARSIASEFRIRSHDGEYHWFSGRMVPRKTPTGELIEWVGTLRDITARKAAEAALRESEARFRAMFELVSVGISEMDLETGRLIHFNERFREITGYPATELRRIPVRLLTHPDDRREDQDIFKRAAQGEEPQYRREKRFLRYSGEAVWVRMNATFVRDHAGRVIRTVAIVEDVTERRLAQAALEESERHYRSLFETMLQGVVYHDVQGAIVSMNPAAERILGRRREEMLGQPCRRLLEDALDERGRAIAAECHPIAEVLRSGGTLGELLQLRNPHETQNRWLEVAAVPLFRDGSREPYQVYTIFHDVTERRRAAELLQQSHDRHRLALEAARAGTYTISLPGGEIDATAGALRLYGFAEDERPVLADFLARIHPEDQPKVREAIARARDESLGYSLEYRIVRPSGQVVWAASRAQPVHGVNGKVESVIGALLDATERMEAARALTKAKEAAESASRAKDQFLAALSHELRTPLSPVLLLASEGSANAEYSAAACADFETIRKNIALEARLIDDLLDLTRITNGKLPLEMAPVELHTVLRDALATVRSDVGAKELQLTVELDAADGCLLGDAVRLQQVFWNLLRNAVKFTPPGGSIRLVTRNTAEAIEVEVTDSGHGMTARELASVFDAFSQGDHAGAGGSHQFGGLGLGLTITRMLVELHGGQISASSAGRHEGSSLTVRLPLLGDRQACQIPRPSSTPAELPGRPATASAARRVLLVEDHPPTRETLSRILTRRGHRVLEAGSVAEAIAVASANSFDVLISDIGLPDGDGCELMEAVRAEHPTIHGIAISGYGTDSDLARSAKAGFNTHLTKPVEVSLIERALSSLG